MNRPRRACRVLAILAALLAAGTQAGAAAPVAARCPPPAHSVEANAPAAHLRGFYDWYLGELRAGRRPSDDDAGLQAWLTPKYIAETRSSPLIRHDRVLQLPSPQSNWINMRVAIGRPKYYRDPGACVAYLAVTYSGFADRPPIDPKLKYVSVFPAWRVGLVRTAAGWRITSIEQDIGDTD